MTIVITRARTGLYEKLGGPPLQLGQTILLDEGLSVLSAAPRESSLRGCQVRAWAVPSPDGHGFYALTEVLPPEPQLPEGTV
jgi:hypothetical protein